MFGSAIIRIVYGLDVTDGDNDRYIQIAEKALVAFNVALMPGKFLVETFPILRYIPKWLPGAKFRRDAAEWRPVVLSMRNAPWEGTVESMVSSLYAIVRSQS